MTPRTFPWATAAVATAAALTLALPSLAAALVYDRAALLEGQVWRLWTGHLVHFTPVHLAWNLALLVFTGGWLERLAPGPTRAFYAGAPLLIGVVLLALAPDLAQYGGLSGLGAGLTVGLALRQRNEPSESRGLWHGVLGLVALKVGLEAWTGTPLLAEGIRSVPLAHLAGLASALAWHLLGPRGGARRP